MILTGSRLVPTGSRNQWPRNQPPLVPDWFPTPLPLTGREPVGEPVPGSSVELGTTPNFGDRFRDLGTSRTGRAR